MTLTQADVDRVLSQPYATTAEVAHINAVHGGGPRDTEPAEYEDGCVLTPMWGGCLDYYRPDEVVLHDDQHVFVGGACCCGARK